MSSKKKQEFREKNYNRNSEGLKQRRLKDESRWKFNPNDDYTSHDLTLQEDEWFSDPDFDDRR